ncbi:MAG: motility associated factor glycosyltransferase family protein [Rhodospirillaceae bacterium]|nr:motility associated factor glycosyltransferase family protein [Rhodospirillaceae bacterium]
MAGIIDFLVSLPSNPTIRVFDGAFGKDADSAALKMFILDVRRCLRTRIYNLGTLIQHGPLWQHNTLTNLPAILSQGGLNLLRDAFPGRPAVVVGAGPSLNNALPHLAACRDRVIVVSTGTALKPLLHAGIRPDLVMSVDGSCKTAAQFDVDCTGLRLACTAIAHPTVVEKFDRIFVGHLDANPIGSWLQRFGAADGDILAAGTVTASAMELARQMGCDPILTVGLDLSMADDGRSHADHSMYDGVNLAQKKLRRVRGNYRDVVLTTPQFQVYVDSVSNYVRSNPATTFINVNDGGARIEGMRLVLPEHMSGPLGEAFDVSADLDGLHDQRRTIDMEEVIRELGAIGDDLARLHGLASEAAMLSNRLMMSAAHPVSGAAAEAADILARLDIIDAEILDAQETGQIIDMSLRCVYFEHECAIAKKDDMSSSGVDQSNRRSRRLYEQIVGAATWTAALINAARKQVGPQCEKYDGELHVAAA